MSKLVELVESLKAKYVVIIEDNIQPTKDPQEMVGRFLMLDSGSRKLLLSSLLDSQTELQEIAKVLANFEQEFFSIEHDDKLFESLLPADTKHYLKEIGKDSIVLDELVGLIQTKIQDEEESELHDIFIQFGAFDQKQVFEVETAFGEIIKELSQIEHMQFAFYRAHPPIHRMEQFRKQIIDRVRATYSQFYLAIVDKHLGAGDGDDEGKRFVRDHLLNKKLGDQPRLVGMILTSRAEELRPEAYDDYFLREVSKSSDDLLSEVASHLAEAAYANVFHFISTSYQDAAYEISKIILKNQKNIKHIVEQSHVEGIPAFDAIKYWFDMAIDWYNSNTEVKDFDFVGGLTRFFSSHYLPDHPNMVDITPEVLKINSFELFDYNINRKYLPIAPGDIWEIDGFYYILLGQLCDILLREGTNTRKSKIAELLPVELEDVTNNDKKYDIQVDKSGTKRIYIQQFASKENDYNSVKITVTTPKLVYADFRVLDLAMFNDRGETHINLSKPLSKSIESVLPQSKGQMHLDLQAQFNAIYQAYKCYGQANLHAIVNPLEIGIADFSISSDEENLQYGVKRVARLKGRYYDSLYNNYINTKSRIDLNLVNNAPETPIAVNLSYEFAGIDNTTNQVVATCWRRGDIRFFKKNELIKLLPNDYGSLLKLCTEHLEIGKGVKQYGLEELEKDNVYGLKLNILCPNKNYHSKSKFYYSTLFGGEKPETGKFRHHDGTTGSFLDEEGNPKGYVKATELQKGIIVPEKEVHLRLVNGIIESEALEK